MLEKLKKLLKAENDLDTARRFTRLIKFINKDPIELFIKNPEFCNFQPTPAQTVALKCVFGQELDPEKLHKVRMEQSGVDNEFFLKEEWMTEPDLFKYMTDQEYAPEHQNARNRINWIVGRRGGKTCNAAMLVLYSAIKLNWKPLLQHAPVATVLVLSQDKEFSEEIMKWLREFVEGSPILTALVDESEANTKCVFNMKMPFLVINEAGEQIIQYSKVVIKMEAASKTKRGKAVCTLLCDEISHWNLDENAANRDADILDALSPSLMQFKEHGMIFKISSPKLKQGLLFEEYQKRRELPENFIVLKAPSWMWSPEKIIGEDALKREKQARGESYFDAEFRANFTDSISNFIFPEYVDLCTSRGVSIIPPEPKNSDVVFCASLDAAFKGDRFAFTLLGSTENRVKQYVIKTWEGDRNKPVSAFEVAKFIRKTCALYGISRIHCDQYAHSPLREIFEHFGMNLVENIFTSSYKRKIYYNLKRLVHNQAIELLDDPLLIREIKQLQVEQTATGNIKIGHPPGGSDDCSDCVAIAAYLLAENLNAMGIAPGEITGIPDYGIRRDSNGRCFDAPDPTTLSDMYGQPFVDNRHEWRRDSETGEWKHCTEEDEDEIDGVNEDGSDFIFVGD